MNTYTWNWDKNCLNIVQKNGNARLARYHSCRAFIRCLREPDKFHTDTLLCFHCRELINLGLLWLFTLEHSITWKTADLLGEISFFISDTEMHYIHAIANKQLNHTAGNEWHVLNPNHFLNSISVCILVIGWHAIITIGICGSRSYSLSASRERRLISCLLHPRSRPTWGTSNATNTLVPISSRKLIFPLGWVCKASTIKALSCESLCWSDLVKCLRSLRPPSVSEVYGPHCAVPKYFCNIEQRLWQEETSFVSALSLKIVKSFYRKSGCIS